MYKTTSFYMHLRKAISGFVGLLIILSISMVIGVAVFLNLNTMYDISNPFISKRIELKIRCFLVTANGYLCIALNPLGNPITIRLSLANGSIYKFVVEPNTVMPIPCESSGLCKYFRDKIVYGEVISIENAVSSFNGKIHVVIDYG
ncbi:MAG: hypothetical protein QXT53_02095 [Ignisphaera sp.]